MQDYTKMYCNNAPKELLQDQGAAGQQGQAADQEMRNKIIQLSISHMG